MKESWLNGGWYAAKLAILKARELQKKNRKEKKPSVATLWKIFSPQSHTLGKWQLGNNGPKLWLFLTCSDGSDFFLERNNMHFGCKLNCAPKACQLWCPFRQLGCNREVVVLVYEKKRSTSSAWKHLGCVQLYFFFFSFSVNFVFTKEVKKWSEASKVEKRTNVKVSRVKGHRSTGGLIKGQMKPHSCSASLGVVRACVPVLHAGTEAWAFPTEFVMG